MINRKENNKVYCDSFFLFHFDFDLDKLKALLAASARQANHIKKVLLLFFLTCLFYFTFRNLLLNAKPWIFSAFLFKNIKRCHLLLAVYHTLTVFY